MVSSSRCVISLVCLKVRALSIATSKGVHAFTGREFRKQLGYERIWSTSFQVEANSAGFVFRGSGSGHGVGLCQWGARGMAIAGFTSKEILGYYYPGAKVEHWKRLRK